MGKIRIIVCQHGARRRYAVSRLLQNRGILVALYTDSSACSLLGKISNYLPTNKFPSIGRLKQRVPVGVPAEKVFSTDLILYKNLIRKLLFSKKKGMELIAQNHNDLSKQMVKWGLRDANVIYTMLQEGSLFVSSLKNEKPFIHIVDVCVSPITQFILSQENSKYPDWASDQLSIDPLWLESTKESLKLADFLFCPSDFVAKGVREIFPEFKGKIKIVPYGSSIHYDEINTPNNERVLFAGGDILRKGLPYLAPAVSQLKIKYPNLDVRIAGQLPKSVQENPLFKDLNFLGKLTSNQIKKEFLSAYCFILPTLAEGMAGVAIEAISSGCPVILTEEAGIPISHGKEGLIIPSCNTEAIYKAMDTLLSDFSLRKNYSENCIKLAPFFSEEQWGDRLVKAIEDCLNV